jgi:hypothetical protein
MHDLKWSRITFISQGLRRLRLLRLRKVEMSEDGKGSGVQVIRFGLSGEGKCSMYSYISIYSGGGVQWVLDRLLILRQCSFINSSQAVIRWYHPQGVEMKDRTQNLGATLLAKERRAYTFPHSLVTYTIKVVVSCSHISACTSHLGIFISGHFICRHANVTPETPLILDLCSWYTYKKWPGATYHCFLTT